MERTERIGNDFTVDVGESLPIRAQDRSEPNARRLVLALRQIGYSLEQALSDLIDNSINAGATTVLIRFVHDWEKIHSVVIADDGNGLSPAGLREAMRFGSGDEPEATSLGKYGLGLKLASLSHARTLTVLSRLNRRNCGRRWTVDGISRGWSCDIVAPRDSAWWFKGNWGGCDIADHGTFVIWDSIDKLPVSARGLRWTLRSFQRRLEVHLGMCFHRFIEDGRLRIVLDQQTLGMSEQPVQIEVSALNPFRYDKPGIAGYPRQFIADIDQIGPLDLEAHIWPAQASAPEYSLGNRAASRQGFYFYRNDRLIQAGGWNGLIQQDAEPHSSLARVQIELPPRLDSDFGLNVQKSAVIVPPGFQAAVSDAISDNGRSFEEYRRDAEDAYRTHGGNLGKPGRGVPGRGFPGASRRRIRDVLEVNDNTTRDFDLVWTSQANGNFVSIDYEHCRILINRHIRDLVRNAEPQMQNLVKGLIFTLLEHELTSDRLSGTRKKRLERINRLIGATLGLGQ